MRECYSGGGRPCHGVAGRPRTAMIAGLTEGDATMTTTVDLGAPLERFVEEAVGSGRYGSRSEVLREGVRLVQERERRLQRMDAAVEADLERLLAQPSRPMDEVFDELQAKYAARAAAAE